MSSLPRKRPKQRSNPLFRSKVVSPSIMEPPGFLLPSRHELFRLLVVVGIASSVAFTCNLIANFFSPTSQTPFCDSNNMGSPDDFLLSDACKPCPMNGECHEGKLVCDDGYRRNGNLCAEDGDSNERAKKLVRSKILIHSGTLVEENEMWEDVKHQVVQIFSSDYASYMYAKNKAMEIIDRALEKNTNPEGITELKCPSVLAERYKPVSCRVRQWIFEHAFVIVPVCAMVVALTWLLWKIRQSYYLSTRGDELYHQVEELVQEDSRIDRYPKLVKGESKVVWEWQVEGSLSSAGKRTKNATVTKLNPDKQTHTSKYGRKLGLMF
ncbi:unnamed protein product [Linum tenue]|uniref:Man1/Src1 C-terminal domain-containing protein n=1 Tax=Linum tenue TaxID=586396 RepID=A0AAV0PKJ1_9ROSI|nr:unnamed protein product [Linum tenue]